MRRTRHRRVGAWRGFHPRQIFHQADDRRIVFLSLPRVFGGAELLSDGGRWHGDSQLRCFTENKPEILVHVRQSEDDWECRAARSFQVSIVTWRALRRISVRNE